MNGNVTLTLTYLLKRKLKITEDVDIFDAALISDASGRLALTACSPVWSTLVLSNAFPLDENKPWHLEWPCL